MPSTRPTVVRSNTFAIAVALVALAFAGPASADSPAEWGPTINTYDGWDKVSNIGGGQWRATFGQVVTIPAGMHRLKKFSMWVDVDGADEAIVNAGVYRWNGTKAVEKVWLSKRRTLQPDAGWSFEDVSFQPEGVRVRPGRQYIFFLSTSKYWAESGHDISYGAAAEELLVDGYPMVQDTQDDPSQWMDGWWSDFPQTWDAAVKIWLR